jgi:glutathione S-transferase
MQKVITDRLRPEGRGDPQGVEDARALIKTSLGMLEDDMAAKIWAMGEEFSMADCAAAPALFYTNMIVPLAGTYKNTAAYLDRLMKRRSYARALKEAEPYLAMVPKEKG